MKIKHYAISFNTEESINDQLPEDAPSIGFDHEGAWIDTPFADETFRYEGVDPVQHYGFFQYDLGGGAKALVRVAEGGDLQDGGVFLTPLKDTDPLPRCSCRGWVMHKEDDSTGLGDHFVWRMTVFPDGTGDVQWVVLEDQEEEEEEGDTWGKLNDPNYEATPFELASVAMDEMSAGELRQLLMEVVRRIQIKDEE